jgi:hypothetical protein
VPLGFDVTTLPNADGHLDLRLGDEVSSPGRSAERSVCRLPSAGADDRPLAGRGDSRRSRSQTERRSVTSQDDDDGDGIFDACDACPNQAGGGAGGCPW